MNYQQSVSYLFSKLPVFERTGITAYKGDLTNVVAFCELLGNPQKDLKAIHVAGTNGKGSTSHMLASILQEKGMKVGLFTSPHLKDFRERIRVNGKKISRSYVAGFVNQHIPDFERIALSFFEMTVGLAFEYFKTCEVDIAVIEVGLGGRLDSTNIITPLVSVITNISFDHMQLLGNTLEQIAGEKAGIIKPGVPIVIGETQPEIRHVFLEKAKETRSELLFSDSLFSLKHKELAVTVDNHLSADILRGDKLYLKNIRIPLTGIYQLKNIITVFGVIEKLNSIGISISGDEIRRGLRTVVKNTHLEGRWQVMSRTPLTIFDTGHNEAGLSEIISQLNSISCHHLHFVFGVVKDKDIRNILQILPKNATYYFCRAALPRALDQEELKSRANQAGLTGEAYPSVIHALTAARKNAGKEDIIFVGGSTFVVAEALLPANASLH
jgi:dihydrofolate synthase / folylpolyglutamate synthase